MKIKTQDLIGHALDWAVARADGTDVMMDNRHSVIREAGMYVKAIPLSDYKPSTNWAQGGPIIEREGIELRVWDDSEAGKRQWLADDTPESKWSIVGPTPLIAAMRCYVASKLGDEVDIPEDLK